MRGPVWRAGALLAAALLAACAGRPPAPQVPATVAWPAHRQSVAALTRWSIEGRVSVRGAGEGGSATLHWHESPDRGELRATGPLGAGSFVLTRDARGAHLRTADGKQRHAPGVAALVREAFGAQIPVDALAYWVRGLPAPGPIEALALNAQGRLASLRQQGWEVEFGEYGPVGAVTLPRRLRARAQAWEVRLAIRVWRLDAPSRDEPV